MLFCISDLCFPPSVFSYFIKSLAFLQNAKCLFLDNFALLEDAMFMLVFESVSLTGYRSYERLLNALGGRPTLIPGIELQACHGDTWLIPGFRGNLSPGDCMLFGGNRERWTAPQAAIRVAF